MRLDAGKHDLQPARDSLPVLLELIHSFFSAHNVDGVDTIVLCKVNHLPRKYRGGSCLKQVFSFGNVGLVQHAVDCHGVDLQEQTSASACYCPQETQHGMQRGL